MSRAHKDRPFLAVAACAAVAIFVMAGPAASNQPSAAGPDNWPQFRGPRGLPVSDNPGLPTTWSTTENVEWVTDVPGLGWSSPIVWGNRVFVTATTSDNDLKQPSLGVDFSNDYVAELVEQGMSNEDIERLVNARDMEMPDEVTLTYHLYSYDLETGELVWDRELYHGPPPVGRHRKNSYMSETPVTDGEAVYVYIGHMGLYAYDFAGQQLWHTELEAHQVYLDFGGGSSPALHGDRILIVNDNEDASFIAAFDKRTGERRWATPREGLGSRMSRSAWSSPYVWESAERSEIVTNGPGTAIGYDLDGQELWRMSRQGMMAAQTPFAWDGNVYITSGAGGGGDRPLVAIRPGAAGDITLEETETSSDSVLWYGRVAGGTYLPTPVVYDGGLYVLTDKGVFSLLNPKTGERIYRTRIHPQASNFTSSPWAYNDHIFAVNEEGDTFVIKAGEEFEFVGINSLDEWTLATPAIVGDRLLMRTQSKLYSIRQDDR